ncbi:MAG: hypothetical protein ABSG93_17795 [Solirubrobacteraceae bacterium]
MFTHGRKLAFGRLALGGALTAIFLAASVADAAAEAPSYNLSGSWSTGYLGAKGEREAANGSYSVTQMNTSTGAFSGTAEVDGIGFAMEGVESGAVARFTLKEGGYTAYDTLHLSILAGGHLGGNGTFNEGGFSESGSGFWAEQATSSSTAEEEAKKEAAKKKEEAEKNAERASATSVICDYEFATSENTCVATVGDAGTGTPVTPTGAVTFTTTSGGFSSGASCSLAPTPGSPALASCTLVYETAESGLPSITATYGGDARHAGSVGHTQFLGAGLDESTAEAPPGQEGQYPNELQLETQVPTSGTTVEATVQGSDPHPLPSPLAPPASSAGLDPISAVALELAEALVGEVDVSGGQNAKALSEMDHSVEALNLRAEELAKGASSSEQAEGQRLLKDAAETTESITKMLAHQSEYAKDALEGTSKAAREDQSIEKLDEHAVQLLQASEPTSEAKGQKLADEAAKEFEALSKTLKQHEEAIKQIASGLKASVASRKSRARIKVARLQPLAHLVKHDAAAGKLKLGLHLSRGALSRLAGRRKSLAVVLRIEMILPSKSLTGGLPRAFVEHITLERAAAGKGGKKH